MAKENKGEIKDIPNGLKFLFGGVSGMSSTLFTQPLDLVKNRMQVSGMGGTKKEYKTSFHLIRAVIKTDGFFSLYSGLSAGLLRQATYTTTRLGMYNWLFSLASAREGGGSPSFMTKAGLGMAAGATGAFVGTPAEVALVRMTTDGKLPVEQRRNYANVAQALTRIVKDEGVLALWRGALPTMGRAMVVNAAQLASYSQAKEILITAKLAKEGILLHFYASMISGLITTIASMPVDIAKTRVQNMKIIDGKPEFTGSVDVLTKVVKREGFFALWKGFTPYYARLGPHTVLTFIFLEQLNKNYLAYVNK